MKIFIISMLAIALQIVFSAKEECVTGLNKKWHGNYRLVAGNKL